MFIQQNQGANSDPKGSSVCTFNLFVSITQPESDPSGLTLTQLCLKPSKDKLGNNRCKVQTHNSHTREAEAGGFR